MENGFVCFGSMGRRNEPCPHCATVRSKNQTCRHNSRAVAYRRARRQNTPSGQCCLPFSVIKWPGKISLPTSLIPLGRGAVRPVLDQNHAASQTDAGIQQNFPLKVSNTECETRGTQTKGLCKCGTKTLAQISSSSDECENTNLIFFLLLFFYFPLSNQEKFSLSHSPQKETQQQQVASCQEVLVDGSLRNTRLR